MSLFPMANAGDFGADRDGVYRECARLGVATEYRVVVLRDDAPLGIRAISPGSYARRLAAYWDDPARGENGARGRVESRTVSSWMVLR